MPTYETTKFLSLPQQVNKNKKDIETLQQNQADISNLIPNTEKGQPLGVATLDINGLVPPAQLPANPGNFLPLAGGTMTGILNMGSEDIVSAQSVDSGVILSNNIRGRTNTTNPILIENPISMNNKKITNTAKGTANGDVATVDNINDHNTSPFAHADIRNLISAIQGAYIYRGVINENTIDVTQINLNARILAIMGRAAILGDVLTDLDRTDWYYDGTSWDNMGQTFVVLASAVNDGLMSKEDYTKLFDLYTKAQLDVTFEVLANKAIDFSVLNDTKYPTTKAVNEKYFDKIILPFKLPNGVADTIEYRNGKYYFVQRVQKYVLQASDIESYNTSAFTNIDYLSINYTNITNYIFNGVGDVSPNRGTSILTTFSTPALTNFVDDLSFTTKHYANSSDIAVIFPKGTYASLATAQIAIAGTAIYYQLATPIETEINDTKTANWLYNLFNLESWLTPTLTTATSTYIRYRKDTLGTVIVEGNITVTTAGTNLTLPVGYRPLFAYTVGILTFNTDGTVVSSATGTQTLSVRYTGA